MSQAEVKMLSNRAFGLIFSGIFAVISLYPLLFGNGIRIWAVVIAAAFFIVAMILPKALSPLNKLWVKFGLLMHSIINPILMGLVFFLTVLPTGIILKILGKDPMRRKFEASAETYWIDRKQKLSKEFFDNQF